MVSVLVPLAFVRFYRGFLPFANPKVGPSFALPKDSVLLVGLICFTLFLAEGTVLDWSGVYLTEFRRVS